MPGSFISALGGLRAHQSWIDLIGNNLANTNTPGFKSSRALFSDLLSVTRKPGTPPTSAIGGTNPIQIGLGVQLSQVDRRLTQGALDVTGRTFDLAMLGNGHFAVSDGTQTLYSRVGSFGLDSEGNMVDLRTGFRVLNPTGQSFRIDTSAVIPPQATTEVRFSGNLPAVVTGPLAEELTSSSSLREGTAAQTGGANAGPFFVPAGETWTLELVVNGGAPQEVSIAGSGSISAQEIADEINAQTDHVNATVTADQRIALESDRAGTSSTIKVNPGESGKDLKGLLGLVDFVQGTETAAALATDLNTLSSNLSDYENGDAIEISGSAADGSAVVATFVYGVDGTTIGELVGFIDAQYGQSTVEFNETTGQIEVTADTTGEADLSLSITDGQNQAGATNWSEHFFAVTTNGTGPDTVTTSLEVFDAAGASHVLTVEYVRQDDGTWTADASLPEESGEVVSGTIAGITFNENGSIVTPTNGQLVLRFGGGEQTIDVDLGTSGQFDGLTMFGDPASVVADFQDGYGSGELSNIVVDSEGIITGFYTNGQTSELGRFGVATFSNESGLENIGDNYFRGSANSGQRILGGGNANGAGEVIGGALEGSNVDTAQEFVHLIEAQRGFQANARVITVQDEIFAEVVNIV